MLGNIFDTYEEFEEYDDEDYAPVNSRRRNKKSKSGNVNPPPTPADPITDLNDIQKIKDYLLHHSDKEIINLRNYAIFCLGVSTGLRCGDIFRLQVGDVIDVYGNVVKELSCCESKTHKMNRPLLNDETRKALCEYLKYRMGYDFESLLFTSQKGNGQIGVRSWYRILREMAIDLNLPYHLSTHSMRKTFAYWTIKMHYYDQNVLFSLQEMLNHSSMQTTLHYSGHTKEHLRTMYNDMGNVLNGTASSNNMISPQEQKINLILKLLTLNMNSDGTAVLSQDEVKMLVDQLAPQANVDAEAVSTVIANPTVIDEDDDTMSALDTLYKRKSGSPVQKPLFDKDFNVGRQFYKKHKYFYENGSLRRFGEDENGCYPIDIGGDYYDEDGNEISTDEVVIW